MLECMQAKISLGLNNLVFPLETAQKSWSFAACYLFLSSAVLA